MSSPEQRCDCPDCTSSHDTQQHSNPVEPRSETGFPPTTPYPTTWTSPNFRHQHHDQHQYPAHHVHHEQSHPSVIDHIHYNNTTSTARYGAPLTLAPIQSSAPNYPVNPYQSQPTPSQYHPSSSHPSRNSQPQQAWPHLSALSRPEIYQRTRDPRDGTPLPYSPPLRPSAPPPADNYPPAHHHQPIQSISSPSDRASPSPSATGSLPPPNLPPIPFYHHRQQHPQDLRQGPHQDRAQYPQHHQYSSPAGLSDNDESQSDAAEAANRTTGKSSLKPHKSRKTWSEEEWKKLVDLAEKSKKGDPDAEIDWDFVVLGFGGKRARQGILTVAAKRGLKPSTREVRRLAKDTGKEQKAGEEDEDEEEEEEEEEKEENAE